MTAALRGPLKPATVQGPLGVAVAMMMMMTTACDLPRDPEDTLEHVRDGVMRVGLVDDPPWAGRDAQGEPRGVEVELTLALAEAMGAEIRWNHGGETRLMAALKRYELDLVIGGVDLDSPYRERVAFTRPYYRADEQAHVLALPPGENRWIMAVDAFLAPQQASIPERLVRARAATAVEEARP